MERNWIWLAVVLAGCQAATACTTDTARAAAIGWQRQACERLVDSDERARCLARVEAGLREQEAARAR